MLSEAKKLYVHNKQMCGENKGTKTKLWLVQAWLWRDSGMFSVQSRSSGSICSLRSQLPDYGAVFHQGWGIMGGLLSIDSWANKHSSTTKDNPSGYSTHFEERAIKLKTGYPLVPPGPWLVSALRILSKHYVGIQ